MNYLLKMSNKCSRVKTGIKTILLTENVVEWICKVAKKNTQVKYVYVIIVLVQC